MLKNRPIVPCIKPLPSTFKNNNWRKFRKWPTHTSLTLANRKCWWDHAVPSSERRRLVSTKCLESQICCRRAAKRGNRARPAPEAKVLSIRGITLQTWSWRKTWSHVNSGSKAPSFRVDQQLTIRDSLKPNSLSQGRAIPCRVSLATRGRRYQAPADRICNQFLDPIRTRNWL